MDSATSKTPGPFGLAQTAPFGKIAPYYIIRENGNWHLTFLEHVAEAERERLCDLLNKGTHFDRLLAAAERVKECEDRWVEIGGVEALKELYAAIAEAKGADDG